MVQTVTLIMPFYDNAAMLSLQYQAWAAWRPELKERWRIILVDDGSPVPAVDVPRPEGLPELSIYRVLEDRPWHQHAARNLGAHVAPEGWMLMTDMDHQLTVKNARRLIMALDARMLHEGCAYTLARVEADTGETTLGRNNLPKPHPNSFVLTRETYWRIGGYDEDYCGVYGTDGLFRTRMRERVGNSHLKHVALTRYWRDLVPDASTRTLERKDGREPGAKRAIRDRKEAEGRGRVIVTLAFPWERVL
jgi:hypothetical protein